MKGPTRDNTSPPAAREEWTALSPGQQTLLWGIYLTGRRIKGSRCLPALRRLGLVWRERVALTDHGARVAEAGAPAAYRAKHARNGRK